MNFANLMIFVINNMRFYFYVKKQGLLFSCIFFLFYRIYYSSDYNNLANIIAGCPKSWDKVEIFSNIIIFHADGFIFISHRNKGNTQKISLLTG